MEDINMPFTRSIGKKDSVINEIRRGTLPHISRKKMINPRRIVTKPAVPVRRIATMRAVPVDQAKK